LSQDAQDELGMVVEYVEACTGLIAQMSSALLVCSYALMRGRKKGGTIALSSVLMDFRFVFFLS
jgi:hypothetical protein